MSVQATISDFLRSSGEHLGRLEHEDVTLRRRDGPDLVVSTGERAQALVDALGLAGSLLLCLAREVPEATCACVERAIGWTAVLDPADRLRFVEEAASAAVGAAELGLRSRPGDVLERWRERARAAVSAPVRPIELRGVAIPHDVDAPSLDKASGVVTLPLHVRWSGPSRTYDLDDPVQLRLAYEQVLQEGTDDDVRRFIEVDRLIEHWDALVLPRRVRRAWAAWLRAHRGVDLAC